MKKLRLVKHSPSAVGLRMFGLGPNLKPSQGLSKLKHLFDSHAFWAKDRSEKNLRKVLAGSTVVVTLWRGKRLIGFGRANSDGIYRAVLWDVVVAGDLQGKGLGRLVVEALLSSPKVKNTERIYLMTTNSTEFYKQLGFQDCNQQNVLMKLSINSQNQKL